VSSLSPDDRARHLQTLRDATRARKLSAASRGYEGLARRAAALVQLLRERHLEAEAVEVESAMAKVDAVFAAADADALPAALQALRKAGVPPTDRARLLIEAGGCSSAARPGPWLRRFFAANERERKLLSKWSRRPGK
jgi:hypothetical protein